MATPSPEVPSDKFGRPLHSIEPRGVAKARTIITSPSTSQKVDIASGATLIKVYAITKDVYLKWASSDTDYCKTDNFDEVIIAGTIRKFPVPLQANGSDYTKIHFLQREANATVIVTQH